MRLRFPTLVPFATPPERVMGEGSDSCDGEGWRGISLHCVWGQHSLKIPVLGTNWDLFTNLWHEFHETCHSVTFIVVVNPHQR